MEHIEMTDEWLYRYMPVLDAAMIQELENQVNEDYEFSRRFERRMRRLIRKEARPWLGAVHHLSRRAAVFFVCIISAAFIFVMSVEAYRTRLFETIKTYLEDSILFSYFTGKDSAGLVSREPVYIPDGYTETDRIENENYLSITYENNKGELILWDQMLALGDGYIVFDLEYDSKDTRVIHGNNATVFLYDGGYKSGYYECEENTYMVVAETLSVDDIYKMFVSIINFP